MSTALATKKESSIPALSMSETELMDVLRNSLYPGAQDASIKMVIGYCKASGLDPMRKPVHIVPMWDSKSGSMRDVIMPGIGSYRSDAAKSGQYAGVSVAEFGPDVTEEIGGVTITYPQWCRVIVKRQLANGQVAEFAATERWKENYAVKGGKEKSIAPNAMWQKRPYAQLEKCAEAQALRKAFPEVGAQPTADEMEGKPIYDSGVTIDNQSGEILNQKSEPEQPSIEYCTEEYFKANTQKWRGLIESGKQTVENLKGFIANKGRTFTKDQEETINSWVVSNANS